MVDGQLSTRLEDSIQKAFRSYTTEFENKAQGEKKRYIDLVEKSVKDIIKNEVKNQLPQILPKEVSDYVTLVIQSTITESLENVVLAKSSSQPKSTYEAVTELYDGLVKSYKLDKDLFESYGKTYSLKRDRKDKDKDEDPPGSVLKGSRRTKAQRVYRALRRGADQGADFINMSRIKLIKSAQAEESVFETTDSEMPQNQRSDLGNTDYQSNFEAASKHDWFNKPERRPTLYSDWNATKQLISDHLILGSAKLPKQKNLISLLTS
ncbi:hypothetical protein Tco_0586861 [Tanacetum coccineum]